MNRSETRHVLRRAGMATRPTEIDAFSLHTRATAVEHVLDIGLNGGAGLPSTGNKKAWQYMVDVSNWWVGRWAVSQRPIETKLMLFFHSHLAVNYEKVKTAAQVRNYVSILHANVLGHWPTMLEQVSLSPAMLLYLDNWTNRVGKPNENFARELFELHLLGHGHYSQSDVAEAARAWTGWTVSDGGSGSMIFDGADHDDRAKTIFGDRRAWTGPALIQHVFSHPDLSRIAARHLARKMWIYFAGTAPSEATLSALADVFRSGGFQIKPLVRAVLNHPDFWIAPSRTLQPRSPVEFVSDLLRVTRRTPDDFDVHWSLRDMGQAPLDPPNPSGWNQNAFVSTASWLSRAEFSRWVTWKTPDSVLAGIDDLPVTQAVERALAEFGLNEGASTRTRTALESAVVRERGNRGWAEKVNLITTMAMSPDMQVC